MKKRMIAMFLCLVMLATALPMSALADVLPFSRKNQEQQRQQLQQNALLAEQQNNAPSDGLDDALLATALPGGQKDIIIHTADGDIDYDATWQKAYPYGAFAFESTDGVICEGGTGGAASLTIPVYRIGGLSGRATAYLIWAAPVVEEEDGTVNDSMALSFLRDATLEVETPDPAWCCMPPCRTARRSLPTATSGSPARSAAHGVP